MNHGRPKVNLKRKSTVDPKSGSTSKSVDFFLHPCCQSPTFMFETITRVDEVSTYNLFTGTILDGTKKQLLQWLSFLGVFYSPFKRLTLSFSFSGCVFRKKYCYYKKRKRKERDIYQTEYGRGQGTGGKITVYSKRNIIRFWGIF